MLLLRACKEKQKRNNNNNNKKQLDLERERQNLYVINFEFVIMRFAVKQSQ